MTADRHQRVDELFEQAQRLTRTDRARLLAEAARTDPELVAEVKDLLRRAESTSPGLSDHRLSAQARARIANVLGEGPLAPGTRLGPFEVIELVGEGGMGAVYRARQDVPDRIVAVKVIRKGRRPAETIRRFHFEADALGKLQHPNIAQIFLAGAEDLGFGPQPFLAMEFIDGLTLTDHMRVNALEVKERLALMEKVCRAVAHAHRTGIVHRDLKPANILVTQNGEPKILDFSIARGTHDEIASTSAQTQHGQVLGTLPYMSPEQLTGRVDEFGPASDIFALGVILYEIVEGRLPHDVSGMSLGEAVAVLTQQSVPQVTTLSEPVSRWIDFIVSRATHRKSSHRHDTADALADDIAQVIANYSLTGDVPPKLFKGPSMWWRRRAALGTITAGMLLMLAIGAVMMFKHRGGEVTPPNPSPSPGPGLNPSAVLGGDPNSPPQPLQPLAPFDIVDNAYEQWNRKTIFNNITATRAQLGRAQSESERLDLRFKEALLGGVAAWFDPASGGGGEAGGAGPGSKTAEAVEHLKGWIDDSRTAARLPQGAMARITLAWLYVKQNNSKQALELFDAVVQSPAGPRRPPRFMELVAEAQVGKAVALAQGSLPAPASSPSSPTTFPDKAAIVQLCETGLTSLMSRPGLTSWRTRRAIETGSAALEKAGEPALAAKWRGKDKE